MKSYHPFILLYFCLYVISHCTLDMRLDYENFIDTAAKTQRIFPPIIKNLITIIKGNPNISPKYDILREITGKLQPIKYSEKLFQKKQELEFNINQIIKSYCYSSSAPIYTGEKLLVSDGFDIHQSKCNFNKNMLIYSESGEYDIMIQKIPIKKIPGLKNIDEVLVMKSRVANLMRAGQCLLNPMAYNLMNPKYKEIYDSIQERTSALSGLIENNPFDTNLDSLPVMDCMYYTAKPDPENGRIMINASTEFYLTYPLMTSNMETLFFYKPEVMRSYLNRYSWIKNNLAMRLEIIIKMVDALISLHKTGIIHKNIRLSNIFYKDFSNSSGSGAPDQLYVSFSGFLKSGIDDYDAKVKKTFFVPDDAMVELGPKIDIYQLGLVAWQLIFMIPAEATPDMTLSKISKMIDEDAWVLFDGKKVHLFEQLMNDSMDDKKHYNKYVQTMTREAAKCSIEIFKSIDDYFYFQMWESKTIDTHLLAQKFFYNFKPKEGDIYDSVTLYKYRPFKTIFVSVFLNLYSVEPACHKKIKVSNTLINVVRRMINPNPSKRIKLVTAKKLFFNEYDRAEENTNKNPTYRIYDNSKFVERDPTMSLLRMRNLENTII